MTTEFKNLLQAKGYTHFSFSEWYYTHALPCDIEYGKKYYMVYKEKLNAFKIIECAYVGKEQSDTMGYSNSKGQYNEWVLHLVIAGIGDAIMTLSSLHNKELFLSVEDYNDYVKTQNQAYRIKVGRNEQLYRFTEQFCQRLGYKNTDRGTWNKRLVGYTAKKGELKASNEAVVVDYLYTDADGVHLHTSHKGECGNDCFPTEQKALDNARVSEIVDFDEFEEEDRIVAVEINISIKATTKDNALEQIMETLDKSFK